MKRVRRVGPVAPALVSPGEETAELALRHAAGLMAPVARWLLRSGRPLGDIAAGRPIVDVLPPEVYAVVIPHVVLALKGSRQRYEYEMARDDGSIVSTMSLTDAASAALLAFSAPNSSSSSTGAGFRSKAVT